jgi:hypothetical protein
MVKLFTDMIKTLGNVPEIIGMDMNSPDIPYKLVYKMRVIAWVIIQSKYSRLSDKEGSFINVEPIIIDGRCGDGTVGVCDDIRLDDVVLQTIPADPWTFAVYGSFGDERSDILIGYVIPNGST